MKLAYVYDAVYPWKTGGVQKRVWELARRLADSHDVHWFGLHYWDGKSTIEREGVTLHGVAEPRDLYVDGRRSIPEAIYFATQLVRPLSEHNFDLIDCQVFPYFSCYASKFSAVYTDATLVMTWHEIWGKYWYEYLGWKGVFGRLVERGAVLLPDTHFVVSHRTQRELRSLGGVESHLLPNGIDKPSIDAVSASNTQVDVLFVGRLIKEKNPELVIRAVSEVASGFSSFRCYLIGDGPERENVEKLIDDLGLSEVITLVEFQESHKKVIALMKAADVFVLPSQREGFGITVLEALASGTPVVTIDHPGNAASELVVPGETGYIVDRSPEALADGIIKAKRHIRSSECVGASADYDWDQIADTAETLYKKQI